MNENKSENNSQLDETDELRIALLKQTSVHLGNDTKKEKKKAKSQTKPKPEESSKPFKLEDFVNDGETPRKGFCIVCGTSNPTIHRRGVKGLSGTADFCTLPGHATWDLNPLLDLRWKVKKENEKKAKEAERQKHLQEKKPWHWPWSRSKRVEVIDNPTPAKKPRGRPRKNA